MKNELFAYDYIIALLEAAKRATRKLKKRKIRRVLETVDNKNHPLGKAILDYLGERGLLKALINKIKEITGTSNTGELNELLKTVANGADKFVKPENLYLLKPALDAMRSFVANCEKLEQGGTGNQEITGNQTNGQPPTLLESNNPTKEQCEELKSIFSQFIEKYEATKKDTPFYKRWYYWFMSLPMWKRILVGFMFAVVLFIILLTIFKVGRKVVAALRRAANGDKTVGKKLVNAANNANPRVKNAAFAAVMDAMPKKAALYF